MADRILIPSGNFQKSEDKQGMRGTTKPQDLKSGTYFGQMQLRGSILVIKDNLNTESGYIAFGASMTTIPTSPTTGTGVYIDYRGIYGLNGGTQQFYLQASDGKAYAGGGTVVLDTVGVRVYLGIVLQAQLDSTGLALLDNAKLGINIAVASIDANTRVHIYETGASNAAGMVIEDVSDTQHGGIVGKRSRALLTATQADDAFLSITGKGHTGSAYVAGPQAVMRMLASQNTTAGAQGSYISFFTTPNGSAAAGNVREVARIGQDGSTTLGRITDYTNAARTLNIIDSAAFLRIYRITSDLDAAAPTIELIGAAAANTASGSWASRWDMRLNAAGSFIFRRRTGADKDALTITTNGSVVINSAAIATNATDGFLYVPACAGVPTGTPTGFTGRIPIVVDSNANKAYIYSGGAWVALN